MAAGAAGSKFAKEKAIDYLEKQRHFEEEVAKLKTERRQYESKRTILERTLEDTHQEIDKIEKEMGKYYYLFI